MRSPDSHGEADRMFLERLGVPTAELFHMKMDQAFACDRFRFGKITPPTVRPVQAILSVMNLTAPDSNGLFHVGDRWRLTLVRVTSSAPVYLRIWKDGHAEGVSGPYGASTDAGGGMAIGWRLSSRPMLADG